MTKAVQYARVRSLAKPNITSPAYTAGYNAAVAGGWWKGCPHCDDTQEFVDWQAGWKKAHSEGHCPVRQG